MDRPDLSAMREEEIAKKVLPPIFAATSYLASKRQVKTGLHQRIPNATENPTTHRPKKPSSAILFYCCDHSSSWRGFGFLLPGPLP